MDITDLEEIKRKSGIFATPLDIDKYISEGIMSRYKNTKTKFTIHCSNEELPEEIGIRANKITFIPNKDGTNTIVLRLNLKVRK